MVKIPVPHPAGSGSIPSGEASECKHEVILTKGKGASTWSSGKDTCPSPIGLGFDSQWPSQGYGVTSTRGKGALTGGKKCIPDDQQSKRSQGQQEESKQLHARVLARR